MWPARETSIGSRVCGVCGIYVPEVHPLLEDADGVLYCEECAKKKAESRPQTLPDTTYPWVAVFTVLLVFVAGCCIIAALRQIDSKNGVGVDVWLLSALFWIAAAVVIDLLRRILISVEAALKPSSKS